MIGNLKVMSAGKNKVGDFPTILLTFMSITCLMNLFIKTHFKAH